MAGLGLLERARQRGVQVHREGADLVLRGPKRETELLRELAQRKQEVLAELDEEENLRPVEVVAVSAADFQVRTVADLAGAEEGQGPPPAQCYACGEFRWWRRRGGAGQWICGICHPPGPPADSVERYAGDGKADR